MKKHIIFGLSISISLSLAAASLAQAADAPIDPTSLGGLDAVLTFCKQSNPAGEPVYRSLKVSIIGRQPDRALDGIESTGAYRQAYGGVSGALNAAPKDWARQACLDILKGRRGDDRS